MDWACLCMAFKNEKHSLLAMGYRKLIITWNILQSDRTTWTQWLNWGYFVIIQLWAWPYWAYGGAHKEELPVTSLSWRNRTTTLFLIIIGTVGVHSLIDVFVPGSSYPWLDALVVVASIIAQFLLGKKKVESWVLWLGPVNLVSITLFFLTGAYTLTALYIAFFIHAGFALKTWSKLINN